jgi:two-component system, NtrC family, sensor histidine kinase GlrK
MRLAPKIFLVSAFAILLLGGVAAWSIVAVSRLAEVNRDIAMRAVPAIETASGLPESFRRLVRLEAKYLVLRDRAYADLWNERATRAASELDRLGTLLATPEELKWHERAASAFAAYRAHVDQERILMARGEMERAQQLSERAAREAAERAEASVVKLTAASNAALGRAQADAAALAARTWTAVTAAFVGSLVAALAATALVAFRMTRSLRQLSAATRDLADGAFTAPLPVDRDDEIGDLGRAFNRMAERLKEVDALKEDFFSHISHDLRNPLTGMRGAAQLLIRGKAGGALEPRQIHLVRVIDESVERMLAMVNQILEFTRLRARLMPLERRPVDLAKLVARALDEFHPQSEEAGIALGSTTSGADFTVHADEAGLMRVVTNLVGNALKFTTRGGSVTAQVRDWGAEVELRVTDTGVGIPADALTRIFDPYRQAHAGRNGSGLGLAVVKGLVEAHGGRVAAESEVGKGSTFVVTLPRMGSAT